MFGIAGKLHSVFLGRDQGKNAGGRGKCLEVYGWFKRHVLINAILMANKVKFHKLIFLYYLYIYNNPDGLTFSQLFCSF